LPGNYNHVLLSELFHIQSSRWLEVAEDHLALTYDGIVKCVQASVRHLTKEEMVRIELLGVINDSLERKRQSAERELKNLWQDEQQQPITYNHYYTSNVQESRQISMRKSIQQSMNEFPTMSDKYGKSVNTAQIDPSKLLISLQKNIINDMDDQACEDARIGLASYYQASSLTLHYPVSILLTIL
jgi:hypothetical protein